MKRKNGDLHCHTARGSNVSIRDSNLEVKDLLDYAIECNIGAVAITDHETVCSHIEAYLYVKNNEEKFKDFKLILGNEIYLVDREEVQKAIDNNEPVKYYHCILLAKDNKGHEAIRRLTSMAWEHSYRYRSMVRKPTYKDDLEKIVEEYKGHLIMSTACLGGEFASSVLNEDFDRAERFIKFGKRLFGKDFYLEMQPSNYEEQQIVNNAVLEASEMFNVPYIITTDVHYLNLDTQKAHWDFLQSSEGEREADKFYATTYMMTYEELLEFFDKDVMKKANDNIQGIVDKIEGYSFGHAPILPPVIIPTLWNNNYNSILAGQGYEYIDKYYNSPYRSDQYYLYLIEEGIKDKEIELTQERWDRIEEELKTCWDLSTALGIRIAEYHVGVKQIVDEMWEVSIVGPSRGSACCFYLNYLVDIVQVDPLKYDLPIYRYMDATKVELSDIDLDSESSKRELIIERLRAKYGEDRVISFGTFKSEKTKSIILTSCRGLGIEKEVAHTLSNMVPVIRGEAYTVSQMLFGDEENDIKPNSNFISIVDSYEGLRENLIKNEGIIAGIGCHASGVLVLPEPYWVHNAMMRTKKGIPVTQWEAHDSEFEGGVKVDLLTIEAADRMRICFDTLLEYGVIEWKGTLRKTWNYYFHPDVLDYTSKELYDAIYHGDVINCFQFSTAIGLQTLNLLRAEKFEDLYIGNSLMRLKEVDGRNPLERYVRFKNDITEWYKEMEEYGLTEDEINVAKTLYLGCSGVMDNQELLMLTGMTLCGYNVGEANKLRKSVSKKDAGAQDKEKKKFFKRGKKKGFRKEFLQYVWDYEIAFSLGYAFSKPHTIAYTIIMMQEVNMAIKYGLVYWLLSNLLTDSGILGDKEKNTDYNKLAKAIGNMRGIIQPPNINESKYGFIPNIEDGTIMFGFKPLRGIDLPTYEKIEEARPFSSFDDFFEKTKPIKKTKKVEGRAGISEKKMVLLVKSGCFDCFEPDRKKLMKELVMKLYPTPKSITMTQFEKIKDFVQGFETEKEAYEFHITYTGAKAKKMDSQAEKLFIKLYGKTVPYKFTSKGFEYDNKKYKDAYDKKIAKLKEHINTQEVIDEFIRRRRNEFWKKECSGNVEKWEMDTMLYYFNRHEIDNMPIDEYVDVAKFSEMPENPEPIGYNTRKIKGKIVRFPIYENEYVVGTVIGKDTQKGYVYLLTQDTVVPCKFPKGKFSFYNSADVGEVGFFERGTILCISGWRKGTDFLVRGNKGEHSVVRIAKYNQKKILFDNKGGKSA